jgi:hypothetical protein
MLNHSKNWRKNATDMYKILELMESGIMCRTDVLVLVKLVHDRRDSTLDKKTPAI